MNFHDKNSYYLHSPISGMRVSTGDQEGVSVWPFMQGHPNPF